MHYFVFLLEHLACHLITKICKRLAHPSLFDAKKNDIFLNFLAIFLNLLFTAYRLNFFPFPEFLECPNNAKICTHLAPLSIFDPTKFQIFLIFLLFFSNLLFPMLLFIRRSNPFDRTARAFM